MTAPFIGEIRVFGFNYAPRNYMPCDGRLLPIAQYTALFSILGTVYGGNGTTNFALPDRRGRVPVSVGNGAGLSPYVLGDMTGSATETLLPTEAAHVHTAQAVAGYGQSSTPGGNLWAQPRVGRGAVPMYTTSAGNDATMANNAIGLTGGSQAHENVPPVLTLSYSIAVQGIFPTRN
jgi:microcystin-dependent protein